MDFSNNIYLRTYIHYSVVKRSIDKKPKFTIFLHSIIDPHWLYPLAFVKIQSIVTLTKAMGGEIEFVIRVLGESDGINDKIADIDIRTIKFRIF